MARVDEEVDGRRRAAERDELGAALLPVRREREGRRDAARRALEQAARDAPVVESALRAD